MNWLQRFLNSLRALFQKRRLDAEMEEEISAHIERRIQANIAAGMPPDEARYASLRQFGRTESIKESCRDQRRAGSIDTFLRDLRFGARQLRRSPGFTAIATLTLALCLGVNLAIFAVVDAVLLRSLPFPEADRLVTMYNTYPKAGVPRDGSTIPNYYERRGNIPAFSQMALYRHDTATIGQTGSTKQENIIHVSPDFFSTLGVGPVMGRAFTEEETTYQTDTVAILTDACWRQDFNADPNIIGREIRVNGFQKVIVGVLPEHFRFLSSKARIYLPFASNPEDRVPDRRHSSSGSDLIARLKPGATLAAAQSQIDAHNAAHAAEYPYAKMVAEVGFRTIVASLHGDHVKAIRPILLLMQAGVLFLLAIGGVNLINLLLIRASARAKELAIRQSLGASRGRVARQAITETVLLTVMGGLFGLAVGAFGVRLLGAFGVDQLPLGAQIVFNVRLALATLGGAIVLGIIVGALIAWFNLHHRPGDALKSESRGGTVTFAAQRLRHGFIIAQIALAFVLLTGTALLGLSLQRAMAVSPGFRSDHILTGQIILFWKNYPDWAPRLAFIDRLLEEVRHHPGVVAAGIVNNVPFSGNNIKSGIVVKGHVPKPGETIRAHYNYGVGGDYFKAMGVPLKEGRFINADDSQRELRVCVVDDDFARYYWPQGNALGQKLFVGAEEENDSEAFTVVGVSGAVKQTELTEKEAQGAIYLPYKLRTDTTLFVVVRTSTAPELFGTDLHQIIRRIDPELPASDLRSMDIRIADSLLARRSPALLAGLFAIVALVLAAIGTYGVLSYAVAQRHREIGVRIALGALPAQIRSQFLFLGMRLLVIGTLFGVIGAALAGKAMQNILFEVPAFHFAPLAGAGVVMTAVCLAACLLPTLRASRVDPMQALRSE